MMFNIAGYSHIGLYVCSCKQKLPTRLVVMTILLFTLKVIFVLKGDFWNAIKATK